MNRWFWAACAGVAIVFGWLALGTKPPAEAPVAAVRVPPPAPPAPAAAPEPAAATARAAAPRDVRLLGVVDPGKNARALLGVQGLAPRLVAVGEPVAEGWSLASVASDHVMLSQGASQARIDLDFSAQASPAQRATVAAVPQSEAARIRRPQNPDEKPLPGFVPADAQSRPRQVDRSVNQRFRDDHQGGLKKIP